MDHPPDSFRGATKELQATDNNEKENGSCLVAKRENSSEHIPPQAGLKHTEEPVEGHTAALGDSYEATDQNSSYYYTFRQNLQPQLPSGPVGPAPGEHDTSQLHVRAPESQKEASPCVSNSQSEDHPPAPLTEELSTEIPKRPIQRTPLDIERVTPTPPDKVTGDRAPGPAPREIGARRLGPSPTQQSPRQKEQRTVPPRAELLCRKPRGSRRWELVVDFPEQRPITAVHQDDHSPQPKADECVLSCFTGQVTITYEDGDSQGLPLYVNQPLIFKLPPNWEGVGRRVRGITKGHYIVMTPTEHHRSNSAPVEPDLCKDSNFTAHYFFHEGDSPEESPGGFGDDQLLLLALHFTLKGSTVHDDSDYGDLFIGSPPVLECSDDVAWARIGEEGHHEGWKGVNFKPKERSIAEVLNGREGRFFIRVFDANAQLQDSGDFRYHSGLQEIRVDGEPHSTETVLVPSPTGHSETSIQFLKTDGNLLSPIAGTDNGIPSIGARGTVTVPAHPDADRVICYLPSDRGEVETVINLPRVWWRLGSADQDNNPWVDTPIQMTRRAFRDFADAEAAIRLKLPRHVASVRVGFSDDEGQVHRPSRAGEDTEIPLSAFAGYTQIDHRLKKDALLEVRWDNALSTLIRISADPRPRILAFKSRQSIITSGESVTLAWATQDSDDCQIVIYPGIGPVEKSGYKEIQLEETTTFTLSIKATGVEAVTRNYTVGVIRTGQCTRRCKYVAKRYWSALVGRMVYQYECKLCGYKKQQTITSANPVRPTNR